MNLKQQRMGTRRARSCHHLVVLYDYLEKQHSEIVGNKMGQFVRAPVLTSIVVLAIQLVENSFCFGNQPQPFFLMDSRGREATGQDGSGILRRDLTQAMINDLESREYVFVVHRALRVTR